MATLSPTYAPPGRLPPQGPTFASASSTGLPGPFGSEAMRSNQWPRLSVPGTINPNIMPRMNPLGMGPVLSRSGAAPFQSGSRLPLMTPGRAATLGRGAAGFGLDYAGDKVASSGLNETARNPLSAGLHAAAPAAVLGAPAAATAGAGVALGTLAGENLWFNKEDDKRLANVASTAGDILSNKPRELTPHRFSDLESHGISASDLIEGLRANDGGSTLAMMLAEAKVDGAEGLGTGEITIKGNSDAQKAIDALRDISQGEGDSTLNQFMIEMANSNYTPEEIDLAFDVFNTLEASEEFQGSATTEAKTAIEMGREEVAAANQANTDALAIQALTMQYLKPVTGNMRARADSMGALAEQVTAGLPPAMAGPMQAQFAIQASQTHALADAYEAQMGLAPIVNAQMAQAERNRGLAAQAQSYIDNYAIQDALAQIGIGGQSTSFTPEDLAALTGG